MSGTTETQSTLRQVFSEDEFMRANSEWGCNCGPSALACATGLSLDQVRAAIPGFDAKRYTSPTMMKAALSALGITWLPADSKGPVLFFYRPSLVRIQWGGPWTAPAANPRWAYRQTHWIATCVHGEQSVVFDCNGGMRSYHSWVDEIVPLIIKSIPRAYGGWWPTHIWRLGQEKQS